MYGAFLFHESQYQELLLLSSELEGIEQIGTEARITIQDSLRSLKRFFSSKDPIFRWPSWHFREEQPWR